jgi:hypothetical protein
LGGGVAPISTGDDYYLEGGEGRFIEFHRDARGYPLSPDSPTTLPVLGGSAKVGTVHEGLGAIFATGPNRCDSYLVNAYGVDRAAFNAFLGALRSGAP